MAWVISLCSDLFKGSDGSSSATFIGKFVQKSSLGRSSPFNFLALQAFLTAKVQKGASLGDSLCHPCMTPAHNCFVQTLGRHQPNSHCHSAFGLEHGLQNQETHPHHLRAARLPSVPIQASRSLLESQHSRQQFCSQLSSLFSNFAELAVIGQLVQSGDSKRKGGLRKQVQRQLR